jgi:hypothetical protein
VLCGEINPTSNPRLKQSIHPKKQTTLKTLYLHKNSDHLEKELIEPFDEGFEISLASYADFYLKRWPSRSAED